MMTSRNARLALAVAFTLAAVLVPGAHLAVLLARLAFTSASVALTWPWRRCGQCRALVIRRYRIEWEDGSCTRLCVTCGAPYAELIECP
jgi:hypothetical protein